MLGRKATVRKRCEKEATYISKEDPEIALCTDHYNRLTTIQEFSGIIENLQMEEIKKEEEERL